jgi:hypothetical protein
VHGRLPPSGHWQKRDFGEAEGNVSSHRPTAGFIVVEAGGLGEIEGNFCSIPAHETAGPTLAAKVEEEQPLPPNRKNRPK